MSWRKHLPWRRKASTPDRPDVDLPCGCRFSPVGRKAWRREWWGLGCTHHELWSDEPRFALDDPGEAGASVATIAVDQNIGHTTVSVFGALDVTTSDDLVAFVSDVFDHGEAPNVRIKLGGLTYMTPAGLAALEQIRDDARARGRRCVFSRPPRDLRIRGDLGSVAHAGGSRT